MEVKGVQVIAGDLLEADTRGKSGLHRAMVVVNGDRGKPQGKCHRKQTAILQG